MKGDHFHAVEDFMKTSRWMGQALLATAIFVASLHAQTPAPISDDPHASTTRPFVSMQPDVPYLPKPTTQPADWIVEHDPVTPNASPEAKALLHFLYSISGKHTLIGQHNYPGEQEIYTQSAATAYGGKTPALYGTDWGFAKQGDKDSAYVRPAIVQELIKQFHNGSIIAICWHEVRPTEDEPVTFMGSVRKRITDQEWDQLLTPGTPLNKHWCDQVDVIAGYLKQLQDAHVPVLWRPYHEINGAWFWWNGRRGDHGTRALYRQLFDRLMNVHHLNNLVWVWNVDQPSTPDRQFVDYFPGQDVVDVLALDDYAIFQQSFYDDLNALSDGKVMAIAECGGNVPTLDIYKTQPKWTYFMRWAFGPPRRPSTRPATTRASFRPPMMTSPALLPIIAKDSRMFTLEDADYWAAIAPLRVASGLPPTTNP
jgi:mannan endo-1,4-beta-mannosidase